MKEGEVGCVGGGGPRAPDPWAGRRRWLCWLPSAKPRAQAEAGSHRRVRGKPQPGFSNHHPPPPPPPPPASVIASAPGGWSTPPPIAAWRVRPTRAIPHTRVVPPTHPAPSAPSASPPACQSSSSNSSNPRKRASFIFLARGPAMYVAPPRARAGGTRDHHAPLPSQPLFPMLTSEPPRRARAARPPFHLGLMCQGLSSAAPRASGAALMARAGRTPLHTPLTRMRAPFSNPPQKSDVRGDCVADRRRRLHVDSPRPCRWCLPPVPPTHLAPE